MSDFRRAFVEAHVRAIHRPYDRPDRRPVGHVLNIAADPEEREYLAVGMRLKAAHDVLTYVSAVEEVAYGYELNQYVEATAALHAAVERGDWTAMMQEADDLLSGINQANGVAYIVGFEARAEALRAAGYEGADLVDRRDYDTPAMRYLESLRQ